MSGRSMAVILALVGIPGLSLAQKPWTPPRTPDGHPDLQGIWLDNSATPLERPKQLDGHPTLTDAEVADLRLRADRLFKSDSPSDFASADGVFLGALANRNEFKSVTATSGAVEMIDRIFDNRTSLIVSPADGKIPAMTPAAQRRAALKAGPLSAGLQPAQRVQDLSSAIRCITAGVPRLGGRYGAGDFGYYQIIQTSQYVVLFAEVIHEARVIPIGAQAHLSPTVRTWTGDSIGRWEADTLVVDTTNFSTESNFYGSAENLHLVERFTRIADGEIRYEIAVDDPGTWTEPWSAMVRLRQTNEPLYEFACHEDNRPLEGILAGARTEDH